MFWDALCAVPLWQSSNTGEYDPAKYKSDESHPDCLMPLRSRYKGNNVFMASVRDRKGKHIAHVVFTCCLPYRMTIINIRTNMKILL